MAVRVETESFSPKLLEAANKMVDKVNPNFSVVVRDKNKKWTYLMVVPCEVENQIYNRTTSKGIEHSDWFVKIWFNPELFDFGDINITETVFVPIRKKVKQSIFFSKEADDEGRIGFTLMTLHAYLEDDDPKHPKEKPDRVKELSTDRKARFVRQATNELLDFLLKSAKKEVKLEIEAAYAAARIGD